MIHYTEDEYPAIWNLMTEKSGKHGKLAWILWYCNPDKNEDINDFNRYIETMGLNMALQELLKPWTRIPFQAKYKAKCGCSQALEYVFYVEHKNGEVQLDIGSRCIENFGDELLLEELRKCKNRILKRVECDECKKVYDESDKFCKKCYHDCASCNDGLVRKQTCEYVYERGKNSGKTCNSTTAIGFSRYCSTHNHKHASPVYCSNCLIAREKKVRRIRLSKYIIYFLVPYRDKDIAKQLDVWYAGEKGSVTLGNNPNLAKLKAKYKVLEEKKNFTLIPTKGYVKDAKAKGYVYYKDKWCSIEPI